MEEEGKKGKAFAETGEVGEKGKAPAAAGVAGGDAGIAAAAARSACATSGGGGGLKPRPARPGVVATGVGGGVVVGGVQAPVCSGGGGVKATFSISCWKKRARADTLAAPASVSSAILSRSDIGDRQVVGVWGRLTLPDRPCAAGGGEGVLTR